MKNIFIASSILLSSVASMASQNDGIFCRNTVITSSTGTPIKINISSSGTGDRADLKSFIGNRVGVDASSLNPSGNLPQLNGATPILDILSIGTETSTNSKVETPLVAINIKLNNGQTVWLSCTIQQTVFDEL